MTKSKKVFYKRKRNRNIKFSKLWTNVLPDRLCQSDK